MDAYSEWTGLLQNSFADFIRTLGAYLPTLIGAALLLIVGWLLAWILRSTILRLGSGLDRLAQRAGLESSRLRLRWPVSRITAGVVFWLVILFFVTAAAESLGLPGLADWLGRIMAYLPLLLAGVVIVAGGYLLSTLAGEAVTATATSAGVQHPTLLGMAVRVVVLTLAVLLGISQLGLDISLLVSIVNISVAALLGGAALAFGLGARSAVSNIIASHYLRRAYRIGQRIRIGGLEGEILDITATAVVLETAEGRALVPAAQFNESTSQLLSGDERIAP